MSYRSRSGGKNYSRSSSEFKKDLSSPAKGPEGDAKNQHQRQDKDHTNTMRDVKKEAISEDNHHKEDGDDKTDDKDLVAPNREHERKFTGRCRLFVGNITPDTSEDDFKKMFEPFGEISEVYLNNSKGFGFIRLDYRSNAEAAKAALDGVQRKGRTLRVRFATHGAALKVKNLSPFVSNELLLQAFSQFGDIERAVVVVDDRGRSTGEGIVEFARKPGASQAMKRINEGCLLLTALPRPVFVEPLEQKDEEDGLSEKFITKTDIYRKDREKEPRFAPPGSFEFEFAQKWRQIDEMEKEKIDRVKREMEDLRHKLEGEMESAMYEYQAEQIRQDLMRQQEELRRLEEMKQEQMRRRQEMDMRLTLMRQEEEMRRREEEDRRRQEILMGPQLRRGAPMEGGPRGREDLMSGGNAPRGRSGAPPLPPPPAPPGIGIDRQGGQNGSSGFGQQGQMMEGSMQSPALGNQPQMMRQSRFDQGPAFSQNEGYAQQQQQQQSGAGGPNMGGGGGGGGQGNPYGNVSPGMGNQRMRNERYNMERRDAREGGNREDFGDTKKMRRY
ncbi:hypothetical protein ScPMuIL_013221 [Solemya velum]